MGCSVGVFEVVGEYVGELVGVGDGVLYVCFERCFVVEGCFFVVGFVRTDENFEQLVGFVVQRCEFRKLLS